MRKYEVVYLVTVGAVTYEFKSRPAARAWAYEKLGDPTLYRRVRRVI